MQAQELLPSRCSCKKSWFGLIPHPVSGCSGWGARTGSLQATPGLFQQRWGWLGLLVALRKQSKHEPAPLSWGSPLPAEMPVMDSFTHPSH